MNKGSLQRVAAFAACATVGALVPVLGATSASAAEPTTLSVAPQVVYIANATTTAQFTVTANGTPTQGVFAYVTSGPDKPAANPLQGTPCVAAVPANNTYVCTVTHAPNKGAGVDNVRFFYDAAGTGTFQTGNPSTNATLSIAGAVNAVTLTPNSANAGVGGYQAYTVSATDADGRQVPGASVTITATGPGTPPVPAPTDIFMTATKPAAGATFSGVGTGTVTVTTDDGSGNTTAGSKTIYVASDTAGTVTLTAVAGIGGAARSTATLVVYPAGVNDITSVDVTPDTQNAFTSKLVSVTVTLRNAQGNPVAGVTPIVTVTTGPNAAAPVNVAGATDGTGSTTATYTTGATAGTDMVRAFVTQTDTPPTTAGLDPGEPRDTASVVVAVEPDFSSPGGLSNNGPITVPLDTTSAPVTFTLKTAAGAPAAGFNVSFTTTPAPGAKYSVSPATAVTDAQGRVTVTVANSAPATGDVVTVTASLVGDSAVTNGTTVTWQARVAQTVVIKPDANTSPTRSSTTFTATTTDQFGDPVTGLTYRWTVDGRNNDANNPDSTGTGTSFTYTDVGPANSAGTDTVTVSASSVSGGVTKVAGSDWAKQYWVVGTAEATQANIDLGEADGSYAQRNGTGPYLPSGFDKTDTAVVTDVGNTGAVEQVSVKLADINGNPLYGRTVTFTSTGVGVFTDSAGKPIGTTATAKVSDVTAGDAYSGFATVYVRSTQVGTQTITASVDGITDTATIIYSGQYVPMTPRRVVDTRIGQGGLSTSPIFGSAAPRGPLAQNTMYYFNYATADLPDGAAAYAFNVTSIKPDSAGNLRVGPACGFFGGAVPQTSLINYQPGKDVANFVVIPNTGGDGCDTLAIYSDSASASVAIDVAGYYPDNFQGGNIRPIQPPQRIADTRTGLGGSTGMIAGGTSREFQITGRGGVTLDAKSVALNVTAIGPTSVGNMRVYPDGAARPNASNINYIRGQDKSAFVIVDLPANGKIRIYSDYGSANVAIDAFDFYPVTSNLVTSVPTRILDTRNTGTIAANTAVRFQVGGRGGVPTDAQAVLISVTGIHTATSSGYGNLRVYPAGMGVPNVSNLNYVSKTSDVASFSIVRLGTNGQLSLYSDSSPINVAVDVVGYVAAGK